MNSDNQEVLFYHENDEYYGEYCEISDKFCNKHILINFSVKHPNFFDIDGIYKDYISNQNRKFDTHLIEGDFKLAFINISSHIKTD